MLAGLWTCMCSVCAHPSHTCALTEEREGEGEWFIRLFIYSCIQLKVFNLSFDFIINNYIVCVECISLIVGEITIQLSTTDLLALASMKNAAKCDK